MKGQNEIFAFLALFFLVMISLSDSTARSGAAEQAERVEQETRRADRLQEELEELRDQLGALAAARHSPVQATTDPPIIILSEDNQAFRFPSGSPEPTAAFRAALSVAIIPLLDSLSTRCGCDAIEIVGHTDGEPVPQRLSSLDRRMVGEFWSGRATALSPGSNVDLGMMRALAVITLLQDARNQGRLSRIRYFLPYSAGQMIREDRSLAARDSFEPATGRRRIEIRLLRPRPRPIDGGAGSARIAGPPA